MEKECIISRLSESIKTTSRIDNELFTEYNVKRGLRNEDHSGVLVGLTKIGNVVGYEKLPEGGLKAIPGRLIYRGIDVEDLVRGILAEKRFGFEETAFLLLSGYLPDKEELAAFSNMVHQCMPLTQKTKMNILDLEGQNIMNILARSVLEMYTFDENPDDTSRNNLMRQSVDLISKFPTIIAYAYNIMRHSNQGRSLHIRFPKENLSVAENFLYMLKGGYTALDARTLDLALMLHAEHGGGNNSAFACRVLSSSGTDIYSSIAAAVGSLKGPRHGGANKKVMEMFGHIEAEVSDWTDDDAVRDYLGRLLRKEAGDRSGLIYGMGHAIYTLSDPRAVLLKRFARSLAETKGMLDEFELFERVERLTPEVLRTVKGEEKVVCANVDLFSGLVYKMMGIPMELYTPLFAVARMVGWCAHRIEEVCQPANRIIRPAYKAVAPMRAFVPLDQR